MMKTKYILRGLITVLLLAIAVSSCESYNEGLLDGIDNTREFSPIGLKATIRNKTAVELTWTVKTDENADHYVVEFSADDPAFKTIYKTVNVSPTELPIQVSLEGETTYSIRVKAVTPGLDDSKWSVTTATTLSEQIMSPVQDADIEAKQVTLRWTPGSTVTQIVLNPGSVTHVITPAEKLAGAATITGLTSETDYTAILYNGTKKRGDAAFKTGIDIGTGILVKPEDDLNAKVAAASSGAVLVLMPGDYTVYTGDIALNKTITIRGLRPGDKPKLHVTFSVTPGTVNLSLIDLDLDGTGITNASVVTFTTAGTFGDVLVSGCKVHDFTRSLLSNSTSGAARINSFTVDNSIFKNVNTNIGAEFIDVRYGYVANIVLQNSTFDTCSDSREFIRLDASSGITGTGLTTNVMINSCTLYKVCTTVASKRLLYSRFASNASTVKNTLITDTPTAIYSNQNGTSTPTTPPTFANNNYYNASLLYTVGAAAITVDKSAYTTLNPQFTNAATGDFTLGNQTLKDNKVGDPRWIK